MTAHPCPRADLRFPLPEGMYWRDPEDADLSWLDQCASTWRTAGVGILCIRYRLLDDREGSPTRGQERECVLDNAGGIVIAEGVVDGVQMFGPMVTQDAEDVIGGKVFYLTEGNMGCGCNRTLEFARAGGEPRPDDHPCDAAISCTWPPCVADESEEP